MGRRLENYRHVNAFPTAGWYAVAAATVATVGSTGCGVLAFVLWPAEVRFLLIPSSGCFAIMAVHATWRAVTTLRDRKHAVRVDASREPWELDWRFARELARDRDRGRRVRLGTGLLLLVGGVTAAWVWLSATQQGSIAPWNLLLVLPFVAAPALRLLLRWKRFGSPELQLARFPIRRGEPLQVVLKIPRGADAIPALDVELRYLEEATMGWYGPHMLASWVAVFEEHRQSEHIAGPIRTALPIEIVPSAVALPTRLRLEDAKFWELEVMGPGWAGFRARFLVPVY